MDKKFRVRFAPSPTGYLHVGGLRSALYNYLFAKKNGGAFVLRIEDTDQARFVPGSVEKILQSLKWAGIENDEGVKLNDNGVIFEDGENGPYIQSKRKDIYKKFAEQLVEDGKAYYCFCEPERLEESRKERIASKKAPMYDQYCLHNLTEEQINENLKKECAHTIRLKVPKGEMIEFEDIVRGKVSFSSDTIDDTVLLKSDGFPTYHLANVVDDHEMKITHVIRGEEWVPSTPKHILLYKAFGWDTPKFAHLPLLLNPDKSKLSKRQGDVAVEDYISQGYLKEALVNFVAFLGWNPGKGSKQEIFSLEELIDSFELEKVHKAGAVFDQEKLNWINSQYIKKLAVGDLYLRSLKFLEGKEFYQNAPEDKKRKEYVEKVLTIEQERLEKLAEIGEQNKFFFKDVSCDKELLRWKEMKDSELVDNLKMATAMIEKISDSDWTKENLEKIFLETAGEKRGDFLWPLRVALTGEKKSPPPHEVAWVLGKTESLKRLQNAINKIK